MNDAPSISVIIPVFNGEDGIVRSITSVLNQTFKPVELIVVDGQSNDRTIDLIKPYMDRIDCFISEKDKGVYSAINKGIEAARGEWVYILGSDDQLSSPSVFFDIFSDSGFDVDLIYGNIENAEVSNVLVPSQFVSYFDRRIYWRNSLHQQGVLYKRSLFQNRCFNESYKVLSDYEMHILFYREKTRSRYMPILFAQCSANGLSKQVSLSLYLEECKIKWNRLPKIVALLNIPWILVKYIIKKWSAKG